MLPLNAKAVAPCTRPGEKENKRKLENRTSSVKVLEVIYPALSFRERGYCEGSRKSDFSFTINKQDIHMDSIESLKPKFPQHGIK
jgi:hypothetical protein